MTSFLRSASGRIEKKLYLFVFFFVCLEMKKKKRFPFASKNQQTEINTNKCPYEPTSLLIDKKK